MSTGPFYVGLDVGGSAFKAGLVDDGGRPLSSVRLPNEPERGQEFGLARMADAVRLAVRQAGLDLAQVRALGVGVPGTLDIPAGVILEPANLKPWRNVPVRRSLEEAFGLPVGFQNDTNAAALGEHWVGAGRGCRDLVVITLGTGIGGGVILGSRLIDGAHSHAGEIGHMRIELTAPRPCGCGRWGCLEAYASATAVVKRAYERLAEDLSRASSLHAVAQAHTLTAPDVFAAAAEGDFLADQLVEETAYYLGVGVTNVLHLLNPEAVVLGGGMIAAGDGFLDKIRGYVRELAFPVPAERTRLCYAELGSDAGVIGAAACGRLAALGGAGPDSV